MYCFDNWKLLISLSKNVLIILDIRPPILRVEKEAPWMKSRTKEKRDKEDVPTISSIDHNRQGTCPRLQSLFQVF